MSIYLRGKSYYYDFFLKGQRYIGCFGKVSRTIAKEQESRLKAKALDGQLNPHKLRQSPTFAKFLTDHYLPWLETNCRPGTVVRNRNVFDAALPLIGTKRLDAISALDIERFKRQRKEAGRKPGSINLELTILKAVFNKGMQWKFLHQNPAQGVRKLAKPEGKTRFLTPEEEQAMLATASPELGRAIRLGTMTGLRRRELLALRPEDVDVKRRTLTVDGAFSKTGKSRTLPIGPRLKELLQECLAAGKDAPVVLTDHTGKPWSKNIFAHAFRRVSKTAVHESLGAHVMRHTFCSRLVMAGVDIRTVQELAGHASITMTMRYAHLTPDHKQAAMERLEQAFSDSTPANFPASAFPPAPQERVNIA